MTVYGDFDFNVPLEALAAKCRVRVGTEQYDRLTWLHATASGIGRPKALVVEAAVEEIDARSVRARTVRTGACRSGRALNKLKGQKKGQNENEND